MSFGRLVIRIPSAKDTKEPNKTGTLVEVRFPNGLTSESTVKCEPVDGYQFRFNADVDLKQPITSKTKLKITVYEYSRFLSNNPLGSCDLLLDDLAQGKDKNNQELELSDHLKIMVTMNWKNPPADAFDNSNNNTGAAQQQQANGGGVAGAGNGVAGSDTSLPLQSGGGGGGAVAKLRPLPDPTAQSYGVRVKIHKLKNLQSNDPEKLYNPRCLIRVGNRSYKTEIATKTNEPTFDEETSFNFEKVDAQFWTQTLSINVASNRFGLPDEQIGLTQFDLGSIHRSNVAHAFIRKWFILCRAVGDGTVMGYCKASIAIYNLRTDPMLEFDDDRENDDEDEDEDDITSNLIHTPGAVFEELNLNVRCVKGRGLPKMDSGIGGSCDGYVKVSFGTESRSTGWIDSSYDPDWRTNITLPCMMPMLTNFVQVQLWDHDVTSPDDLIATKLIDVNEMRDGRVGQVPLLYPRYFNFYGHPRACDADLTRYYMKMARGLAPAVDFRGRALLGFSSCNHKGETATNDLLTDTKIKVQIKTELLQLSHLSFDGEVKIRVSCGTDGSVTGKKKLTKMLGEKSRGFCCYLGDTVNFVTEVPICIPPDDHIGAYPSSDMGKPNRGAITMWQQIPDIVIHIIPVSTLGKLVDAVTGAKDEEPIASLIIPSMSFFGAPRNRVFVSKTMLTMRDPDGTSDGEAPTNPMIQVHSCMVITSFIDPPPHYNANNPTYAGIKLYNGVDEVFMPIISALNSKPLDYLLQAMIYHAKNVPAGDDNGLSDPYVVVSWANASGRTGYKTDTLNPDWNETINMNCAVYAPHADIQLELWDYDMIGSDTFLAKCVISHHEIDERNKSGNNDPFWISNWVDDHGKELDNTSVLVKFVLLPAADPKALQLIDFGKKNQVQMPYNRNEPKKTYTAIPIAPEHTLQTADFSLKLNVIALRKMRKFRLRKITAPKIVFEAYGQRAVLSEADVNLNFNKELNWVLPLPIHATVDVLPNLSISVLDRRLGSDSLVAVAQIPLDSEMLSAEKKKVISDKSDADRAKRLQSILSAHKEMTKELAEGVDDLEFYASGAFTGQSQGEFSPSSLGSRNKEQEFQPRSINHDFGQPPPSATPAGVSELNEPLVRGSAAKAAKDPEKHQGPQEQMSLRNSQQGTNSSVDMNGEGGSLKARIQRAVVMSEAKNIIDDDTKSDASTEPDEPLWYDRYDPNSIGDDIDLVSPDQFVARFGRLGRYSEYFRNGKTLAEDALGPFSEGTFNLQLFRGWGSDAVKAGSLLLEANLEKLPKTSSNTTGAAATNTNNNNNNNNKNNANKNNKLEFTEMTSRRPLPFLARVYILQCRDLTPMDNSLFTGKSSDPYVVLRLSNGADNSNFFGGSSKDVIVNCQDQCRYQVTDPEYFFSRELSGQLPIHSFLRVSVFDHDKLGSDELIGFTDINLEERYYSSRGYRVPHPAITGQRETLPGTALYGLNNYGCYTERRRLQNVDGLSAGNIEMWVDIFDFSQPIPRPIDIAPPPPIPMELRVIVWNVRDCELTDENFAGERMTDIYVRAWIDGMQSLQQNTDVHYRSLDGSGSFNWRMIFPIVFDPRLKKVYPYIDSTGSTSESGGAASTALNSLFSIRKEAKKLKPRLKIQLWDNDIFPGTDDYIGEASLDMLSLRPIFSRRKQISLVRDCTDCCRTCWNVCPCARFECCQCGFCKPRIDIRGMNLEQRQEYAAEERRLEKKARDDLFRKDAERKLASISDNFSEKEHDKVLERLISQAKKTAKINVFKEFLPQRRKKSQREAADAKFNNDIKQKVQRFGSDDSGSVASKAQSDNTSGPIVSEVPRQWFTSRSPWGGVRVGDTQISISCVRIDAIKDDEKLAAGKGRSAPQAMPEPDRPDSSFFWLSSPWKSAIHIFWKNYKWWIVTLFCIVLIALATYLFFSEGIQQKARNIFA